MKYILFVSILLAGCSNPYDDCLDREKESYRNSHPNASFAQINSKQQEFEMMCSSYKPK